MINSNILNEQTNNEEPTTNSVSELKTAQCIQFLNEIDFLVSKSTTVPLTSKIMVDADELYSLTEKFRSAFPSEIEQANMVIGTVQDIVERAEAQAEKIIYTAELQARNILNESRILREAQEQANTIVGEAVRDRDLLRKEAEEYLLSIFGNAETGLSDLMLSVKKAKHTISNN